MPISSKPKLFYGWVIVIAAGVVILVMYGTLATFGLFFQPVLNEFGWSRAMTAGAYSLVIVVRSSLYAVTGRLTDRYGPRAVVTLCGILLGAGYLLMSQISSIWHFYLFFGVLVGAGMSSSWVPQISTVARWFKQRRGLAIGIAASGEGLGVLMMVPIATWLISLYDWRISYMAVGLTSLILIVGAAQFLRRDPKRMGLLPYGEKEATDSILSFETPGLTLREAMRTREFWLICAVYFSFSVCLDTIFAHIAIHTIGLGIPVPSAANILAIFGGMSIIGRISMGAYADRAGSKSAIAICLALLTIDLLWLQLATVVWTLYLFAIIFGFIFGGLLIQFPLIASERFGLTSHGTIFGIISFAAMSTGALGPVLVGRIYDTMGSYQLGFYLLAAISATGLFLSLLSHPVKTRTAVTES
jgi:MFS family permease